MRNVEDKMTHDGWKQILGIMLAFSLLSFAILTSTIWVEKSYTINCSLMDKYNDDGWLRQFFEVNHKVSIKAMIEHGDNKCNMLLDASIMTHIILIFRGLN